MFELVMYNVVLFAHSFFVFLVVCFCQSVCARSSIASLSNEKQSLLEYIEEQQQKITKQQKHFKLAKQTEKQLIQRVRQVQQQMQEQNQIVRKTTQPINWLICICSNCLILLLIICCVVFSLGFICSITNFSCSKLASNVC